MARSDAARALTHDLVGRARAIQSEVTGAETARRPEPEPVAPPGSDPLALFDGIVTDVRLATYTRTLFRDGHYARAVEEAFKYVNNLVKGRTGAQEDGWKLMMGAMDTANPELRLSRLRSISEIDEQEGYRHMLAGAMRGIRNPRAHENDLRDEPGVALELIAWANHLSRVVSQATRRRRRRGTPYRGTRPAAAAGLR